MTMADRENPEDLEPAGRGDGSPGDGDNHPGQSRVARRGGINDDPEEQGDEDEERFDAG